MYIIHEDQIFNSDDGLPRQMISPWYVYRKPPQNAYNVGYGKENNQNLCLVKIIGSISNVNVKHQIPSFQNDQTMGQTKKHFQGLLTSEG